MQCTSYVPVYYHARDLNAGANGFSWHLFNNNANFGEERGFNISLPPSAMDQYLSYDKEMLSQIIQNQEATFRNQVQELHRLYKRQKELMDEMRMRQIFSQHLLSQTSESLHSLSHISQTSNAPNWLLGDRSHSKLPELTAENIQEPNDPFMRKNSCKINEKRVLPADVSHDDELKPSKVENPEKRNCFIDLNEEPSQMEIMHDDPCDGRSDGVDSSLAIDLNYLPDDSFSETGINFENNSVENTNIDVKYLKTETCIDLNSGVAPDESSPLLSRSPVQIKSAADAILVGPVSPENEECSPPRGKSEDIQHEAETLPLELDTNAAADALLMISSSDATEKLQNCLCWFAEIVSSTDLENEVIKIKNDQNLSRAEKNEKSRRRRTRQNELEGFLETGSVQLRRNAGKKGCTKARKSMSSILKQPITRSKRGFLQSWGKMRKREGGGRRRASKFLVIS